MAKIRHIAMKVDDLDICSQFYEKILDFKEVKTRRTRDHISRHLTDGNTDLTLIKYDSEESAEARASGSAPCLHHFGVTVDDIETTMRDIQESGCEIISDPGVLPIKFRVPGGAVMEVAPEGHFIGAKE